MGMAGTWRGSMTPRPVVLGWWLLVVVVVPWGQRSVTGRPWEDETLCYWTR